MGRLDGKIAIITGAGTGIGRASAELFASEGARIVIAEIDVETGKQVARCIADQGGHALFVQTDVTDSEDVAKMVATTVAHFGGIDILYNNAGGSTAQDGPVTAAPESELWRSLKLDLLGTWLGCRHAIPIMIERGEGAVINMSSIVAFKGVGGRDAYTAAKGAVTSLTRSMAVEFAPHRIRVNAIAPAITRTQRLLRMMEQNAGLEDAWSRQMPLGMVEPSDVAATALFLASSAARRITGTVIAVDGGAAIV